MGRYSDLEMCTIVVEITRYNERMHNSIKFNIIVPRHV